MRALLVVIALAGCYPPGYGDDPAPADAAIDGGGETPDAAPIVPDAAPVQCEGAFRLEGHGAASSVWLTGDFVAWAGMPGAGAIVLTLGGDGAWTGTRTFDEGTYLYKFIVDGASWIADPGNPNSVDDGFGGTNSVYSCGP